MQFLKPDDFEFSRNNITLKILHKGWEALAARHSAAYLLAPN